MRVLLFAVLCVFHPVISVAEDGGRYTGQPTGQYVAVALRMASDVASEPIGADVHGLLGQVVSFDEPMVWLDGQPFDKSFEVLPIVPVVNLREPNLSDIMILPPDIEGIENCWKMAATVIEMEGKGIDMILRVDRRVLVVPVANSSAYLLLEKPLFPDEIERLQAVLKDMKFYDGEITGTMDAATRAGVSGYADYRGAEYRFIDTVITENLLAGLDVLRPDP